MRTLTLFVFSIVLIACSAEPGTGTASGDDVRIVRDEYGMPHIYADTIYGLYYGYGYSIAQDRLFQMEMARRSTQGMVAEVYGADYLDYDKNARVLFSPASIRQQLNALEKADRDLFDGYAEGVNAWLAEIRKAPGELTPRQFIDLDFAPTDWTAYDVAMIFIGTMNNRYGDFNTELENAAILAALIELHGEQQARDLFNLLNPRFTDDAPTTIPVEDWSRPAYDSLADSTAFNLPKQKFEIALAGQLTSGFSNCFILGKDKLVDGGSILINGPQFGWFNPSYVYSVGMHGAGIDVAGNTPFGYPMIMFGHNKTISWGSTWGASDIVDIFAENLNSENANQYLYKGEYIDLQHRTESIAVRGSATVSFDVYRSVHGPIIRRDVDAGVAYAKHRAWDGGELDTLLSWLHATWAVDFNSWKAQAEKSAINVNMYFADVDGNIGYFHGGQFPKRVAGHDNRFPVSGDGSMDWLGRQSVNSANPHVLNPTHGFLANWNNKPGQGVMNPDFFFYSWSSADRVELLHDALNAKNKFTPDEAWAVLEYSSYADLYARYFLPIIDMAIGESEDAALLDANILLQSWNRQSVDSDEDGSYDELATGIFRSFVGALIKRTLSDDLGEAFPYYAASGYPTFETPTGAGTNLPPAVKAILEAIKGGANFDVFNGASVASVVESSMRDALAEVNGEALPVAPRPFSPKNFLGIPQAGAEEMMMAPIEQNRGTENNMIVMQRDAIVAWEVTPPGQSGFISPRGEAGAHYNDQFEMYQKFGKKRVWFYAEDIEANKQSEIRLSY